MQCSALGRRLTAACVVTAALLTGCSSGSSKPAVCSDIENLKAAVQDLGNVNVAQNGVSAVSDQLTKIRQQLQTLQKDAKGQYATEVNDLSAALQRLQSSLDTAKASPSAAALATVASSAGNVLTAGKNLATALSNTC